MLNGDLGYIREDIINPQLLKRIKRTSISTIIGPVRIDNGYHFVQVIDRKNAGTVYPFSRVKDSIKERLMIEKRSQLEERIINNLIGQYTIVNKLNR